MTHYVFKTYIADGREYFEYGEQEIGETQLIKKDFPFPESLMRLYDLDIWKYEPLTKRIDRALLELYPSREERLARDILSALDELAEAHIYFEFLRLDWKYRIEKSRSREFENALELLPHKVIAQIPSDIDQIQRQMTGLFANVLDIDSDSQPVSKRMARHYREQRADTLNVFQFKPLSLSYELTDEDTFSDVLCPKSIYDLINFYLRECVKREQRMRVCKNCGRYFAITGRASAEYCDRAAGVRGGVCREVGAAATYAKSKVDDKVYSEFRREYKKRFGWIRAGRITAEDFYAWSERARAKKAECDDGRMTLEEFSEWLKNS